MSQPIELIRGSERMTVYDDNRANMLAQDGWQRVSDLSPEKQAELRNRPPSPWKGYDDLGVADVLANAQGLPPQRVEEVVRYESATKGRVSIINKLTGRTPEQVTSDGAIDSGKRSSGSTEPPVTVETVKEAPMETTETVEVVDKPKGKGK